MWAEGIGLRSPDEQLSERLGEKTKRKTGRGRRCVCRSDIIKNFVDDVKRKGEREEKPI